MKWMAPLLLCLPIVGQDPQDDQICTDDVSQEFLRKIRDAEQKQDWRALFALYDQALKKYSQKVVPHPERPENKVSVVEYLLMRFSNLPPEALEHYRGENDPRARVAFERAFEEEDLSKIQRVIEEYFFSSGTDEVLDRLASQSFDRRLFDTAIFYWNRLLRYYPDSDIPKAVTAARIAVACQCAGRRSSLDHLREYVKKSGIDGEILVGKEKVRLSRFVEGLQITPEDQPVAAVAAKLPSVPEGAGRFGRRIIGVRNDIKRWTYDFASDTGESSAVSPPDRTGRVRIRIEGGAASPAVDFPLLPAYARIGSQEYVIATNGLRVIAFRPAAVRGESFVSGVYWKYPENGPIVRPRALANPGSAALFSLPFIGATVEGEHAFVTLYSERLPRETNPNNQDTFDAPTRLVCIHIPTGRVLWDTDTMESLFKGYEFTDLNFALSSPPLVKGRHLYVGIGTSPMGEQRSYVLCLDRTTGRPLWSTFISWVPGGGRNMWGWDGTKCFAHLTLLTESGGALFVQTNLGTVAALDAVNGNIHWLATYKRAAQRQNWERYEPSAIRPANPPILYQGVLYVLPQDTNDLLAFDIVAGAKLDLAVPKAGERELQWRNVTHLVGIVRDWMILGGQESYVLRMKDFKAYGLPLVNTSRCGRSVLDGETVYFASYSETGGDLAVYHGVGSWRKFDQTKWKSKEEYGNLLVAGNYLVVATDRIHVYTDTETLRAEYIYRVKQSPALPETLLEYGAIMRENDKLEEAAEAYLEFVRIAEGDPKYEAKVRAIKVELYDIFLRRGDEASKASDAEAVRRALGFYRVARGFAYDGETESETGRKIAQGHERLREWREAVAEYQKLLRDGAERTFRPEGSNTAETLWNYARRKIDDILVQEADAYRLIEREAAEALRKIGDGDVDALRKLREIYPNSKAAREAWQKIYDSFLRNRMWGKVRGLLEEFRRWYGGESSLEDRKKDIDLLAKAGDAERLVYELDRLRRRYGEDPTVRDYVEGMLRSVTPHSEVRVSEPLAKVGEMESLSAAQGVGGVAAGYVPLRPLGIVPPNFLGHFELFQCGSSIEMWDLREKRRMWSRPHPGGYLGVAYEESKEGGVRIVDVRKESPAERAGLRPGDVLLEIGGAAVTVENLPAALRAGTLAEATYRRDGKIGRASCEIGSWPREVGPAIVGAAFTRYYELAVVWEDGAASLDLESGGMQWFYSGIRDRLHVVSCHATDGCLYLYEAFRPERSARPLRVWPPTEPGQTVLRAEEAFNRLLCLDDFSGSVIWMRVSEITPTWQSGVRMQLHSKYLSDVVAVVESGVRAQTSDWTLAILNASDGQPVGSGTKSISLSAQVPAYTVDLESGVLYYVDSRDPNHRLLRSVIIDPSAERKPIDVSLQGKYMDAGNTACQLAANRDFVCLLVPSANAETGYRVWVFHAKDGKEYLSLSLPENRTLPQTFWENPHIDEEGILYLYNVSRTGGKGGWPGFLTAYRLTADVARRIAWDAVAPSLTNSPATPYRIETGMQPFVLFYAPRGSAPSESGEAPIAALYSKAEGGYLRMLFSEVSPLAEVDPVAYWRGRLYVNTRTGLQIYGNP